MTLADIHELFAEAASLAGAEQTIVALPSPVDGLTPQSLAPFAGAVFAAEDQVSPSMPPDRAGWIHHPPYDWTLPRRAARTVLFCGPRRRIAAAMLRTALRRGVRGIIYAGPRGLKRESVAAMLARRGLEVALHRVARRLPALERLEGRRLEEIVTAMLDATARGGSAPSSPSRIVLANHSLSMGGAERQIVNTLVGLKARGFGDLALACERRRDYGTDDMFGQALARHGVPIMELAGLPVADTDLPTSEGLPHSLGDDVVFWAALLRAHRPGVLHAWQDATSIKAGLAAALVGVPRIVLAARNRAPWRFGYWLPWMRPAYRALSKLPNVVLTNNSQAGARDYERWLGLPDGRIQVIYNALAPEATMPVAPDAVALRARFGIPVDAPVIGSIFRFYPEKNPELWIATAAAVAARKPEARFLLVGDGPLKSAMQAASRRAGIAERVVFAGETGDPRAALAAMRVFLLTSREEGLPNVAIEAQAQGVPVVTTAAGGAPEALDHGKSGFVVDAADPESLAKSVLRALDDRAWAGAARDRARAFVAARFGVERMLDETLRLYGLRP